MKSGSMPLTAYIAITSGWRLKKWLPKSLKIALEKKKKILKYYATIMARTYVSEVNYTQLSSNTAAKFKMASILPIICILTTAKVPFEIKHGFDSQHY